MRRNLGAQLYGSLVQLPALSVKNPTAWLFVADLALFATSCALYAAGTIGRVPASLISFVCLYCMYTVTHDAAHGNAHPIPRVNRWMGTVAAAIEGLTFPLYRVIHLQHHAYTNDPVRDPDYVIGRQPQWLLPLWTAVRLTHDNLFMFRRKLWAGKPRLLREHLVTVAIQFGLVAAMVWTGHFKAILWVWLGPVVVSGALLELTVAWAVHYPHVSSNPLENTRVFHGRLVQVLMLNQNYHLVHHLWMRIPWYRYQKAAAAAELAVAEHSLNKSS